MNKYFIQLCKLSTATDGAPDDEDYNRLLLHTEVHWLSKGVI